MKKFKLTASIVVIFVVLIICIKINFNKTVPVIVDKTVVDVKTIEDKLRLVSELITLTYNYSNVGTFSDQKYLSMFGNQIGILGTKKSFIITYDGEMKFGIDLSKISISENNNILNVTLPEAQMFSHEMKEDSISLLDEKSGVFNSFSMTDYADFMIDQKDEMEKKASEKEMYEKAKLNAEIQIKMLLSSIPGISEEYDIRFVNWHL